MPAFFESGVFGQNIPAWHKEGRVVDGTFSLDEAFEMGDLDWTVEKRPIYTIHPVTQDLISIPDKFAVTRIRDNRPLGVVGPEYKPIQNREAFSFLEQLLDDKECRWETAISVHGGRTVAGIVSLADSDVELVKGDHHFPYLAIVSSHDGSTAVKAFPSDIRIVCGNTVQLALNTRDKGLTVNIRHSGDTEAKIKAGRDVIRQARADYKRFMEWQRQLIEVEAKQNKVEEFINELFPAADPTSKRSVTMRENKVTGLLTAVDAERVLLPERTLTSMGQDSVYLWLNGLTHWVDHDVAAKKGDERGAYAIVGGGNDIKNKGMVLLSEIFEVPLPERVLVG